MSIFLKKMSSFWQFFDIQLAIFRRVRWQLLIHSVSGGSFLCRIGMSDLAPKWVIMAQNRKKSETFLHNISVHLASLLWRFSTIRFKFFCQAVEQPPTAASVVLIRNALRNNIENISSLLLVVYSCILMY